MFSPLLKQEWRMLRRDPALWLALAGLALLTLYGVYSGCRSARFQRRAASTAAAVDAAKRDELRGQMAAGTGDNHPAALVFMLVPYATLRPAPLSALVTGQSDLYPAYFLAKARSDQFYANEEIENPLRLLMGRLDLAFIVVYLYPLLVLALTYNLLSAERERGTLALALSQPITARTFLLAKVGVRMAAVILTTLGISVLALLWGGALGGIHLSRPEVWFRAAFWMAVVAVYGCFWFAVALLANAAGRNSATNAVALGTVWLVLVIVVPAVLNVTAAAAYPVPSRVALIASARAEANQDMQQSSLVLSRHYADHPEFAPPDHQVRGLPVMTEQVAVEEKVEQAVAPVTRRFERQQDHREALVGWGRFLSPAILAQEALAGLAGTGGPDYRWFEEEGKRFRSQWREFFRPRIYRQQLFDVAEFDRIPRFQFHPEPASAWIARVLAALAGMLVPSLLLGGLALSRLKRYSVQD